MLTENESTYIPIGMTHRLENPGKLPLHLIEVQSGSYLGEDDIVRLEDVYQRCLTPRIGRYNRRWAGSPGCLRFPTLPATTIAYLS